ncbi:hypothetical protein COY25_02080 [Candidatus Uhrbacteria bacterium CG_4_10_14_0_2_um_filter_41_7]|uniref:DUF3179 domain-containing protein n=1 Tax=Candidatus Uhrbacteria bacterium CG_4_9_14_3_um_filter_41_35 TaxID=1975034 RepID=A0A2M7XF93_9BACT|nr:MAG: hypothetical protein COV92_00300 [Candidatus Uhrbacteria bacterium CG11_big_fil_rev_8_21_14_0_20_41_9]PIZ54443.1 MAG: hypothetical protein COY25_02080 [Candidatus Uhrbacteria bacterium CG_4_10_14_0_2_um_filter_41_7]PJA46528.1 MAG: hypothetical protein CO173_02060 [Candidatus Uhrbacteria bacterium CG_4_9_14_3_um_filter_41_35]
MKKILIFIVLVAVFSGGFYAFQQYQTKKTTELFSKTELVNGILPEPIIVNGEEFLVRPADLYDFGADETVRATLDNPKFTNVATADEYLADEVFGINVEVNGAHRFYSYQILNWHQVVNDNFDGKNLTVTYCVFCRSFAVFETNKKFDLDGRVYNNNVLIKDRENNSSWLQIRGLSVIGNNVGEKLNQYQAESITWSDFKKLYPEGEVLSTDTGFVRDYTRHPYASYDTIKTVYFPLTNFNDVFDKKDLVHGVDLGDVQIAFSEYIMRNVPVETVDYKGHKIVGFLDEVGVIRIFKNITLGETELDSKYLPKNVPLDEVLDFTYDPKKDLMIDNQTGSKWNRKGEVIEGPLLQKKLKQLESVETFWFCYSAMFENAVIADINAIEFNKQ